MFIRKREYAYLYKPVTTVIALMKEVKISKYLIVLAKRPSNLEA
jgi:hypothetical protein